MTKQGSIEETKRNQILKAAEEVFAQKGFFKATIEEIAEQAQIAKGTVYLYFPDKPSIFINLLAKKLNETKMRLLEIKAETLSSEEKLRKIFDYLSKTLFKPKYAQLFQTHSEKVITLTNNIMSEFKEKVTPQLKEIIKIIAEIINQGIKDREFKKFDPKLLTLLFISTIRSLSLRKFYPLNYHYSANALKELFFEILKPRGKND
ncbi:MAG: TetR/AcrR family transcriptional regulator [candidate division WOR-3 bacterium]|nr:TetR/AcrR family transcriptional regulator [candidate division WOR-3 bacterium]MCX7757076.1 TetR/AcrR family transcriptional regulator [candidate division WOR-3 bacterium]MDW7987576.1 TetR/AcrR family transcriptional regulator [candidate division WOR-3 bacterium]